jgi:hypothetical protein
LVTTLSQTCIEPRMGEHKKSSGSRLCRVNQSIIIQATI